MPVERGSTTLESIRRVNLPVDEEPGSCEYEELIVTADLNAIQTYCPCGASGSTAAYALVTADVAGRCGTTATTPDGPYLPGFVSKSLGSWTNAAVFPGVESLRWNCAGYEYADPCTSVVRDEVFFGVTTRGGYDATELTAAGPGAALPLVFIDQSSPAPAAAVHRGHEHPLRERPLHRAEPRAVTRGARRGWRRISAS